MSASLVWKFFSKTNEGVAQCSFCFKKLKTGGGTTNLRTHLKNKHPQYANSNFTKEKGKQSTFADISVTSPSISSSGIASLTTSPLSSPAPTSNSTSPGVLEVDVETGRHIAATAISNQNRSNTNTVCPPHSPSLRQLTLQSTQERIFSYERGGKRDAELTNALVYMVCQDNLPHTLVDKTGFVSFCKTAVPLYRLPCRKTLTALVSSKYNAAMEIVKAALAKVTHISLSADVCTITNTSKGFLVVTAHFIDTLDLESGGGNTSSSKLTTLMLGVRRLRESHTGNYIADEIEGVLKYYNISKSKIVAVCTDGGANMIAGVRKLLGEGKHIYCFAHLLNLIVTDGLGDNENGSLKSVIKEIKSIVTFGRQSNLFMDKLRAEQEREGIAEGNVALLIQSVPTRWNSTYHMIKRFIKLSPLIAQVLANPSIRNAPRMISGADIELMTEVLDVLAPFDEATKEISGSEYITGSLVIPLVTIIENAITNVKPKHSASIMLSIKLLKSVKERSSRVLHNPLLCHATLSDPRFKKKIYMSPLIASQAISNFSQEVKHHLADIGKLSPLPQRAEVMNNSNPLWSSHDQEVAKSAPVESFPNELKLYLQQPLLRRGSDPFDFWEKSNACMPGLSFIAQKYLTLIGSSVASERLVSTLNDVVSNERTRLTDQHISERVFMNRLDTKYWPKA